ncbi:hypothetical protein Bca4012_065269 [Brassica carinata]
MHRAIVLADLTDRPAAPTPDANPSPASSESPAPPPFASRRSPSSPIAEQSRSIGSTATPRRALIAELKSFGEELLGGLESICRPFPFSDFASFFWPDAIASAQSAIRRQSRTRGGRSANSAGKKKKIGLEEEK